MANVKFRFYVKVILVELFLSASAVVNSLNIHEHMTEDEIHSVFNTKPDSIPKYEVVPVFHKEYDHHTRKVRSYSSQLQLRAFGRDITLYLEPTDHVLLGKNTPVYTAIKDESQPLRIRYTLLENAWPDEFRTYQDPKNQAAVTIHRGSDHQVNIDGIIGDDIVIKSLPSRVQKSFPSHFRKSGFKNRPNLPFFNNDEEATHHILYRQNQNPIIGTMDNIKRTGEAVWNNLFDFRINNNRFKRSVFDTVYPQLLIIVDYETYKAHGKNIKALTKYMAAFWNGVDLRYRDMNDPKVRLNIAGLIIPEEAGATPYMEYYRRDNNLLEDRGTLEALGRYLYKENRFSSDMFDIAVGITNLDMCMIESGDVCNPLGRGLGFYGGACKHSIRYSDKSVAILEDSGGFSGIATAAHEIGHVLGAPHDGEESMSYIGGPGAKNCNWNDGYLMSSLRRDSRGLHWSTCSIESMQHFLKKEAYCLRNKPVVLDPYLKILPGKLLSREEQCRRTMNMVECKITKDDCGALWCVKPDGSPNCVTNRAPAEGSSCGDRGICLDGECVLEPKELISITY